jgi:hypothetical protein
MATSAACQNLPRIQVQGQQLDILKIIGGIAGGLILVAIIVTGAVWWKCSHKPAVKNTYTIKYK